MFEQDQRSFVKKAIHSSRITSTKITSWQVAFYAAGFPCAPYSLWHRASKVLKDPNAKQMLETVRRVKRLQPVVPSLYVCYIQINGSLKRYHFYLCRTTGKRDWLQAGVGAVLGSLAGQPARVLWSAIKQVWPFTARFPGT